METLGEWERKSLIKELLHGMEMTRQLQLHLVSPSSSHENQQLLASRIVESYEKVLAMLNWSRSMAEAAAGMVRSTPSFVGSPQLSGDSEKEQELRDPSKKRKAIGLEQTLDDGYTWRKYGQKDILGAKYPRGYYKCTNRNNQGCLATKQVQRSNDDPNIYEITYCARHTCNQTHKLSREQPTALAMDHVPEPSHMRHTSGLLENIMDYPFEPQSMDPGSSFANYDGWTNVGKSETDHLSEIFTTSGSGSSRSGFAYDSIIEFNQTQTGPFN